MALVIRVSRGGSLFLDDASYLQKVELAVTSGEHARDSLWRTAPTFFRPLVVLGEAIGTDPLVSQLALALVGSLVPLLAAGTLLLATKSPSSAFTCGVVIALFPSQILWSALVLRDPIVWLGVVVACASLSTISFGSSLHIRRRRLALVVAGSFGLGCSVSLAYGSRPHAGLLIFLAVVVAWLFTSKRKLAVILTVGTLLALVPALLGFSPFGLRIIENGSRSFTENRAVEIEQAETPHRCFDVLWIDGGEATEGGWENDLRCLPSSISMFLTSPWPDQVAKNFSLIPPFLELFLWFSLYVGVLRVSRDTWRSGVLGKFVLSHLVLTVVFWSMVDRVIGTAFRHRGEILASLCVAYTLGRHSRRRTGRQVIPGE